MDNPKSKIQNLKSETLFPLIVADAVPPRSVIGDPRVSEFAEFWTAQYKAKYGTLYIFYFAKDYSAIKRLLNILDSTNRQSNIENLKCLQAAAERLFNGRLSWFKGKESIGSFSKHINHLLTDDAGCKSGNAIKPKSEDLARYRKAGRTE